MVYTAAGTPSLALKDGGVATYNAAQSDPAGLLLVFDYTVGAANATPDLGLRPLERDKNCTLVPAANWIRSPTFNS